MAAQQAAAQAGDGLPPVPEDETTANIANMNRYKLKPPFFNGDHGTFEEWKYKFTAYMGLQDNDYAELLQAAERGTAELTEVQLRAAAATIEDGERHVRLSTNLRYILINTTNRSCSHSLQTIPKHNWLRDVQTIVHPLLHPIGDKIHRTLDKIVEANI